MAKDARDVRVSDLYVRICQQKRLHEHGRRWWLATAAPLFALKMIRTNHLSVIAFIVTAVASAPVLPRH